MKKILYLILATGFLVLSIPPFNLSFLVFVAFVPLFLFARDSRFLTTAAAGALVGALYFGVFFYWIGIYSPLGGSVIILVLSLYFGLYLALTGYFLARSTSIWFDWLFPGALWVSLRWIAGLWKPLFSALHLSDALGLDLRQSIYLAGENGLVLFIFLVNGWIYNFVRVGKPARTHMIQLLVLAILLLGMNSFARMRLAEKIPADIPVAAIQPNLPYDDEWRKAHYGEIQSVYEKLTRQAAESKPAMIFWPQYGFPEDLRKTPNPASRLAQELATPILLGTYVKDENGAPLNVALYFSADGRLAGEYVASFLPPLREIGQKRGNLVQPIATAMGKIGVLLCFEDAHPYLARQLVKQGAEILVVLCNDEFFGRSNEPTIHAGLTALRALEADRYVVRVAPTGLTQIIDPRGRILGTTKLFTESVLTGQVGRREGLSPFARTGDLISYLALGLLGGLLAVFRRKAR